MDKPKDLNIVGQDSREVFLENLQAELEGAINIIDERVSVLVSKLEELSEDFTVKDLFKIKKILDESFGPYGNYFSTSSSYLKLKDLDGVADLYQILGFLNHDLGSLSFENLLLYYVNWRRSLRLEQLRGAGLGSDEIKLERNSDRPHEFDLPMIKLALKMGPQIALQFKNPYQIVKGYSEICLEGRPRDVEEVNLREMITVIAHTLQLRFYDNDYKVFDKVSASGEGYEIILDLQDYSMVTHRGMIWSIFYNLMKNAAKELSCLDKDKKKTLYVKMENLSEHDVTLVHVVDSGRGLSVDEIMYSVKEIVKKKLIASSGVKEAVGGILSDWEKNPFAVRGLELGDVYDMAAISRVSGFSTRERTASDSSGLGLWGIDFLIKHIGGGVISTNTLDGGALFTVIIPNDHFDVGKKKNAEIVDLASTIKTRIESGEIPVDIAV